MTQWAQPKGQDKKKKPKKEMGAWMDIAQVVLPIAASVIGTPLAGAAVSMLLEGAETKAEGGSWKDAAMSGAMSGGLSAATGGIAGGIGGKAGAEGAKQLGKGAVQEAGKKAIEQGALEGAKQAGAFGLDLALDEAGNLAAKTALQRGLSAAGDSVTGPALQQIAAQAATGGLEEGAKVMGDADAKQRFVEHLTDLGTMSYGAYQEGVAESNQKAAAGQAMNAQLMRQIRGAMNGEYVKPKQKHYTPYGG